jgi:hypothetical protein
MALAHQQKIQAIERNIFFGHITNIMTQALLQKYAIMDCLIVINVVEAPPTVEKLASVFLSEHVTAKYRSDGPSIKRMLEQNRQSEALTVLISALETSALLTVPGNSSPLGSWREAQAVVRGAKEGEAKNLWRNPDELERRPLELRVANISLD